MTVPASRAGCIEVRTCLGDVLFVPPVRLSWGESHPRLIDLIDIVADILLGRWEGPGEGRKPGMAARLEVFREFAVEVGKVAGFDGSKLDLDIRNIERIHEALRGAERPDPTGPGAAPG